MTRFSRLIESIGQQRDKVIEYQTRMTELPALGPENGGTGEMPKALYLEGLLRELGVTDILRIDAPDSRVPDGVRPNVIARIPGASPRRLWILGHMDVVPPGELSYWKTDPWKVVVDGDKIRGRGVEDNQQAIVCGLLIAQELKAQGITPDLSLGLIFVSDEETSSRYGIHYILKTHADLFGPDDFVVVPDYGVADGSSIEISEKGQLWMRVEVLGHQCHASRPQEGRNSLVAAADMILHVRDLESIYAQVDPLFFKTICPGKFVAAVTGDVAAVSASVNAGRETHADALVDWFIIPNIHRDVIGALAGATGITERGALGIIETFSAASIVVASDAAVKAADVQLLDVRVALGLGGKGYALMTGDVAAVNAAVEAGSTAAAESGLLVSKVVIPSPAETVFEQIA